MCEGHGLSAEGASCLVVREHDLLKIAIVSIKVRYTIELPGGPKKVLLFDFI